MSTGYKQKPGQDVIFEGSTAYSKAVKSLRAKHGVAILKRNDTEAKKISIKTKLNAIAVKVKLRKTITISSLH
jgi:hypothetical protein